MDQQGFAGWTADRGPGAASGENLRSWITEARERKSRSYPRGSSAVLIPFLIRDGAYHVLYEVRAAKLRSQPGEICFPGGRIEAGESPMETAIREATEELCIDRSRIEIVGALDDTIGPGAVPLFTYIGLLHGYDGTWSRAEVDRVFTLPLEWILTHEPEIYRISLVRKMPEDFPYDYIPGGRDYQWREQFYSVPFYPQLQTDYSLFEVPEAQMVSVAAGGCGQPESVESRDGRQPGSAAARDAETCADMDVIGDNKENMENRMRLPVLWGVTARVTHSLAILLQDGGDGRLQQ